MMPQTKSWKSCMGRYLKISLCKIFPPSLGSYWPDGVRSFKNWDSNFFWWSGDQYLIQGLHWSCRHPPHEVVQHSGFVERLRVEEHVGQLEGRAGVRILGVHPLEGRLQQTVPEPEMRAVERSLLINGIIHKSLDGHLGGGFLRKHDFSGETKNCLEHWVLSLH